MKTVNTVIANIERIIRFSNRKQEKFILLKIGCLSGNI